MHIESDHPRAGGPTDLRSVDPDAAQPDDRRRHPGPDATPGDDGAVGRSERARHRRRVDRIDRVGDRDQPVDRDRDPFGEARPDG